MIVKTEARQLPTARIETKYWIVLLASVLVVTSIPIVFLIATSSVPSSHPIIRSSQAPTGITVTNLATMRPQDVPLPPRPTDTKDIFGFLQYSQAQILLGLETKDLSLINALYIPGSPGQQAAISEYQGLINWHTESTTDAYKSNISDLYVITLTDTRAMANYTVYHTHGDGITYSSTTRDETANLVLVDGKWMIESYQVHQ